LEFTNIDCKKPPNKLENISFLFVVGSINPLINFPIFSKSGLITTGTEVDSTTGTEVDSVTGTGVDSSTGTEVDSETGTGVDSSTGTVSVTD